MKLIDYINAPNHPIDIPGLNYYKSINFKCEIHGINLDVEDGYEVNFDITRYFEEGFLELNPHIINDTDYLGFSQYESHKKKKIIYCKQCQVNLKESEERYRQENPVTVKPKKVKGRKSEKYK